MRTKILHSLLVLCSVITVAISSDNTYTFHDERQERYIRETGSYHFTIPSRVSAQGDHISHSLYPGIKRSRRSPSQDPNQPDPTVHYKLQVGGEDLVLKVRPNYKLYAPSLLIEKRTNAFKNVSDSTFSHLYQDHCHFIGKAVDQSDSSVAVEVCNGLRGLLQTNRDVYFIEPVKGHPVNADGQHPHVVYKRSALPVLDEPSTQAAEETCGVHENLREKREIEHEEREEEEKLVGRRKRSISTEKHLETLVVVDPDMMEYYKNEDVPTYVLTVMNMVAILYHDASIGNAINIVVVRLLLLEKDQEDMTVTHHADKTLRQFCQYQKAINFKEDDHPNHHDVAILLTRKDICSRMNEPCSTLGLAHISGICKPRRSCNINEDTGLNLAYTIAHELGHNFGMKHDGVHNDCDMREDDNFLHVMMPHLLAVNAPMRWSNCSRRDVTKFIDRGWGFCLDDEPSEFDREEFRYPVIPPGTMYDADHQCRLAYDENATLCENMKLSDICQILWCRHKNKCATKMDAAAEGTICGENMWCFNGNCTVIGERPMAINGNWGEWSTWSECTRTCGAGVTTVERHCDNPPPSNGGKYCIGERRRYKICNTQECDPDAESFVSAQCKEFNDILYQANHYEWEYVPVTGVHCQLHCKPKNRFFSVMMKDMVTDGTPCTPGTRNMCIAGRCRHIGCDWQIDSAAKEDRCGVCHGDGSSCETIKEQFNETQGLGYVEATVIPKDARNIYIEEVAEASNYLAVQDEKGRYLLNGDWFIQWSGDYEMAGTVAHYERSGNKEKMEARGPLKEPLHIMLLLQTHNPGVIFEYTVPKENITEPRQPIFSWRYMDWTHCTSSCGGGSQRLAVVCTEIEAGIVEDKYCNATNKPDDKQRSCNEHLCPARWWYGAWQHCSVTCGVGGVHRRTVMCVRSRGQDEQIALENSACAGQEKPEEVEACHHKDPCPGTSVWITGDWSACTSNPCYKSKRRVFCEDETLGCENSPKPVTEKSCSNITCVEWETTDWAECTRSCGGGIKYRKTFCPRGHICDLDDEPSKETPCNIEECPALPQSKEPNDIQTMFHAPNERTETLSADNYKSIPLQENKEMGENTLSSAENTLINIHDKDIHQETLQIKVFNEKISKEASIPSESANERLQVAKDSSANPINHLLVPPKEGDMTKDINHMPLPNLKNMKSHEDFLPPLLPEVFHNGPLLPELPPMDKEMIPPLDESATFKWQTTEWNECSRKCKGGIKTRSVYCMERSNGKTVADGKCDIMLKPNAIERCNIQDCGEWQTAEWTQCTATCGYAMKYRQITCPENHICNESRKPLGQINCDLPPCLSWVHGQWSECSKSCDGGVKYRLVQCVNMTSQFKSDGCPAYSKPDESQVCNSEDCPEPKYALQSETCTRDIMNPQICRTLKRMRQCYKLYLRTKCCITCNKNKWLKRRPNRRIS